MFHSHYIKQRKGKRRNLASTLPYERCPSTQAKASQRPLCSGVPSQKFLSLSPELSMGQGQQHHLGRILHALTWTCIHLSPSPGFSPSGFSPTFLPTYGTHWMCQRTTGLIPISLSRSLKPGPSSRGQPDKLIILTGQHCISVKLQESGPPKWHWCVALKRFKVFLWIMALENPWEALSTMDSKVHPDQTYFSLRDKLLRLSFFYHLLHKGENVKKWNSTLARSPSQRNTRQQSWLDVPVIPQHLVISDGKACILPSREMVVVV